ncbi:FAD-dependent monooxygenase [Shewanella maritima]|uniref:FAD-dependent monooxygenase n=1 Tax=Shewanella maritima TaxID=2520507 RepID=UPI0037367475
MQQTPNALASSSTSSTSTADIQAHYDAVVVGGGMVGAATALGLGQLGLSVAMIEALAPTAFEAAQPMDVRVSAISVASAKLLSRLGVMDNLLSMRHLAYTGLETWEIDGFMTQFNAEQIDQPHLGYFFENRLIQLSLWQQIESVDNIDVLCPEKVAKFSRDNEFNVVVELEQGGEFTTSLLVGADGANSQVRQWAGIGITGWDYAQSAMLINVALDNPIAPVTWQQFTPDGPRSLLPLPDQKASLVWYDSPAKIKQLMQLPLNQLATKIRQHFPDRLDPGFTVEARGSFPLTRRHAQQYYQSNVVILGDAAHTINPLAGQGVNIGFKDVDVLITEVASAIGSNNNWHSNNVLKQYQRKRYYDNQLMMTAMDVFYAGFSNDILPLKFIRNGALKLANMDNAIKRKVLKYAIGIN